VQGRKGLLLGDDTYVSGMHMVGMETMRIDCLYAMIETPGCANSEGNFPAPPNETGPCGPAGRNLNCCGGYTGNDGHGVSNATVEDVTVEGHSTQNMFFMPPTAASKRVSRDIVRARSPGRLSALSVFLCRSVFYGVFAWACRALKHQKRWFLARADRPQHASERNLGGRREHSRPPR
jgi:hypothetical protein